MPTPIKRSDGAAVNGKKKAQLINANRLAHGRGKFKRGGIMIEQRGLCEEVISDHGGQFISHDFARVNKRLGIHHDKYEKGRPWQNLIESHFGIQARMGEYYWERCQSVEAAVEFHRDLIRDHNRLPHWAHRQRNDEKHSPLAVLG